MVGKTVKPTKGEKSRMDRISRMRCVACWNTGLCCGPTEVHHLTSGGRRRGHAFTVPMGRYHHRGIPLSGIPANQMRLFFGPSLAKESKAFRAMYGTDDDLLSKVNSVLSAGESPLAALGGMG